LGWSPKDNREILPIGTLIELFDLADINKNNAHFDAQKLSHFNAVYTKELSTAVILEKMLEMNGLKSLLAGKDSTYLQSVIAICQEKLHGLEALPAVIKPFLTDEWDYDEAIRLKLLKKEGVIVRLTEFKALMSGMTDFTPSALELALKDLASANSVSPGEYLLPARFAVSGVGVGPSFYPMLSVLGKLAVLARLERCIHFLSNGS
jgi:glutamyl-tRNA synthetase